MGTASKRKAVKRRDGKPTRREKSQVNKSLYRRVVNELRDTRPEPKRYRSVTPEDLEAVIQAISEGDTARGKCRELGVSIGNVLGHIVRDETLFVRYARARQIQAHVFVEQNIDEADEAAHTINTDADGANIELGILKHKFEVRRWTAGKYHVGAYGEKVTQIIEGGERPVRTVNRNMTEAEVMAEYEEELKRATPGAKR